MFIDRAIITIKSGRGGDGCTSFKSFKGKPNGGPDGGDGGRGGDIIFKVAPHKNNLIDFKFSQHFKAGEGERGGSNAKYGKSGKDIIIEVPRGTVIRDKETNKIVADMFYEDDKVTVLKGGRAGKGNIKYATATRKTPHFSQLGEKGMVKQVILELKTIADAGFVGFPNVGKSTLLSILTNAHPKIANYHFTTISPNLGMFKMYDESFVLADIPGLIEGASEGAGLGHYFLRHVERTRLIVHVIDISGQEGRDPYEDYLSIRKELEDFSSELAERPEIIVLNKTDCDIDGKNEKKFVSNFENKDKIISISAISHKGLEELKKIMYNELEKLEETAPIEFEPFEYSRGAGDEFEISRDEDGVYVVVGQYIENLARNVVLDDMQSLAYMQKSLKDNGVVSALKAAGVKEGDTVRLLDIEFDFVD